MLSENPIAQVSYNHLALQLNAACLAFILGAENMLSESCRLNVN
jgi:hypothetical protein